MTTFDPIKAVDLSNLTKEEHAALRQEAIRQRMPLSRLLGKLVAEASEKIIANEKAKPAA